MKLFGMIAMMLNITMVSADCPPDAVMDLVFLVDTSSSIRKAGSEAIDSIRQFIHAVVNGFTVGPEHTQFGAISYNRDPAFEFMLGTQPDTDSVLDAIDQISFEEGRGTETGKAINFMSELFELEQFGVRKNSKVVAVVITDGRSNDSPLVRSGQERLKKIVDVVIAVGVNMKKENELSKEINLIASDPDEHYAIEATSYTALQQIKDVVKDCICMGISQQHCFMPVMPPHPMMDADDMGFDMLSRANRLNEVAPISKSGRDKQAHSLGGHQRPIAGGHVVGSPDPTRTQADACCGQQTYNTGLMKCCAFGKADNEKHLVEIDFSCPEGSTEIDWEVHGVQLDHEMMDMNMMEMMGFNLMGPLDF